MHYFWKRLGPDERRKTHRTYLGAFIHEDISKGFERYEEVMQLVERRAVVHTIPRRFNVYLCYRNNPQWPAMELRAWARDQLGALDFRFKQGAEPDDSAAHDLTTILSAQGVDMHELDNARFDTNSLLDLAKKARAHIDKALNREARAQYSAKITEREKDRRPQEPGRPKDTPQQ